MASKPLSGEKLEKELARLEAMKEYEYTYEACSCICGIDEAGRGPLAGPRSEEHTSELQSQR